MGSYFYAPILIQKRVTIWSTNMNKDKINIIVEKHGNLWLCTHSLSLCFVALWAIINSEKSHCMDNADIKEEKINIIVKKHGNLWNCRRHLKA